MVFWFAYSFDWNGTLGVLVGVFGVLIGVLGVFFGVFAGVLGLCSKQSLSRSLWKKVHRLEKKYTHAVGGVADKYELCPPPRQPYDKAKNCISVLFPTMRYV